MANRLDKMPFNVRARGRYDWVSWFDGGIWELVRGVDFDCTLVGMRSLVTQTARARGVVVTTQVVQPEEGVAGDLGKVVVRARPGVGLAKVPKPTSRETAAEPPKPEPSGGTVITTFPPTYEPDPKAARIAKAKEILQPRTVRDPGERDPRRGEQGHEDTSESYDDDPFGSEEAP